MKGFLIKEFLQIFRDKRTMVILFGMPIVQVLLFGFAITMDIKDVPIAVLDQSKDQYSTMLVNKITSSNYFKLYKNLKSQDEIEASFRSGKIKEVLVIQSNFSEKLQKDGTAAVEIITDASDPNTANIITNYTQALVYSFQKEVFKGVSSSFSSIQVESKFAYNESLKSVFMFIPGIITILLMLISAMMTSISIAKEKELGTMEILLVSPIKPIQIVIGKVLPYVLLSFINASIIMLMAFFVFGMPFNGSVVLILAESLLFIVLALSLGIFISTVSNSQQTAMMLSMFALMLPTILLSGFIFPVKNMPYVLQLLSNVMPPKWFITIVKGIMLKGNGLSELWFETLIIFLMTLFFIALSVKKFKIRLD